MLRFALFVALVAILPLSAGAAGLPTYPFIHVSGSGEIRVRPDLGQIDFEVAAVDGDPAVATALVATRVAEIRVLMEEQGVSGDELEVRDMRKDIRKDLKKFDTAAPQVEVRCGVKIVVKDLARWKAIVAPLLDKPNLDGFMTAFDTSERDKVEAALMNDAIRMARRKAEGIAAGFGRKLGPVSGVSIGELKNLTRSMNLTPSEFYQRGARRGDDTPRDEILMVNLIKLSQGVDVIFRIK